MPHDIKLPQDDAAAEAMLDRMVEAYGSAIQAKHGTPDSTFDSPYIKSLQREGMRVVAALLGDPIALTRGAYYKGRDYGKRAERDKREGIIETYIERARYWKEHAKTLESELQSLRGKTHWNERGPRTSRAEQPKTICPSCQRCKVNTPFDVCAHCDVGYGGTCADTLQANDDTRNVTDEMVTRARMAYQATSWDHRKERDVNVDIGIRAALEAALNDA